MTLEAPALDAAAVPAAPSTEEAVLAVCRRAKAASRPLRVATRAAKDAALLAVADALVAATARIVAANEEDLARGRAQGTSAHLLDRLRLDPPRVAAVAAAVREVAAQPDPVGEVVRGSTLPNGLRLRQLRVPMGVLGVVYEARPNVTVDVAVLALKSGNAVVLRGGSAAASTNTVLVQVLRAALESAGLPADAVTSIDEHGRDGVGVLLTARGLVDLLVPRGGAELIQRVVREATVPVIETGVGNCHVYVDASADLRQAVDVVLNAKTSRPSVCNAAETVLVHSALAADFLPTLLSALHGAGVVLHADAAARAAAEAAGVPSVAVTDEDWAAEYHGLEIAVGVVDSVDEAVEHIARWSSGHTEAVLATDVRVADRFCAAVDSAVVAVNASTRFTDGGEFGLGAEVGISTQKLHARGPMGLSELTTTTWQVLGDGHVRV
ncbi:glutamate-5-semialdehyde dehydrogenase [Kineococcus sp. T13]|uniref:glutamate-5-semialdehyde dehydrogenase n=1 Tax=Kineococcus vitellinus TaxID=2696565 RepID=UPI001412ABC5|nr:glutamate-5-semialdehyde dehydrogenase [Kineococcus vitellinus]NAZ76267.1 glutamate-5-semialdehyde dehydrogenase [Kineococcus vitellinus]